MEKQVDENRYGSCLCGVCSFVKNTMNLMVRNKINVKLQLCQMPERIKNLTKVSGLISRCGALTLRKHSPFLRITAQI